MKQRIHILLALLLLPGATAAFETNGRVWPDMPIPYWVNPSGCPVLPSGMTFADIVAEAAAQWCSVPCASVSFEYMGTTSAGLAEDGQNTFLCIAENWNCGAGAAGCNVWIPKPVGEPPENDIAINADELVWVEGGPDATQTGAIDPVSVMAHEIGHMLGLAHSPDPFATMYYGSLPNGVQATISGDDRAGICSLYPSGAPGCTSEDDCGTDETCRDIQGLSVCDELHDGPGAFCNKSYIDCEGMCWVSFFECTQVCLFTNAGYTDGYCTPLCETGDCPDGFTCQYFAQPDVHVCVRDGPAADGGDGDDGEEGGVDGGTDGQDAGADACGDGDSGAAEEGGWVEDGTDDAGAGADESGPDAGSDDGNAGRPGGGCGCGSGAGGLMPILLLVAALARGAVLRRRRTLAAISKMIQFSASSGRSAGDTR